MSKYSDNLTKLFPEEDFPYVTRTIFLKTIERESEKLTVTAQLLNEIIVDDHIKNTVINALKGSVSILSDFAFCVMDNQITFTNREVKHDK